LKYKGKKNRTGRASIKRKQTEKRGDRESLNTERKKEKRGGTQRENKQKNEEKTERVGGEREKEFK
jgi:hypothetical protein